MPRFRSDDGLSLHYEDAGEGPAVLCLPGLTRNSADFAFLLPHLAGRRVIRPDYRGRGQSDRAPDHTTYNVFREARDALQLLDHLGIARTAIVGTSRGGLIAMALAATARDRLTAVVLNDIGPVIHAAGLARIMDYVGLEPDHADYGAAARALAQVHAGQFPGVPVARWRAHAEALWEATADGLRNRYDPALATALREQSAGEAPDLWTFFDALRDLPAGVIRGENSDLLTEQTVAEMKRRHPGLRAATVPDRGHVPFLDEPEAVALVHEVLSRA